MKVRINKNDRWIDRDTDEQRDCYVAGRLRLVSDKKVAGRGKRRKGRWLASVNFVIKKSGFLIV